MGESAVHKSLIDIIYRRTITIIPENHDRLILMDGNENLLYKEVPPIINGFRPDLYYEFNQQLIIGEAKTSNDYATKHSIRQYREYLSYCNRYEGDKYLIISCPWNCVHDVKRIIEKMKKEELYNVKTIYLDELSGD